MTSSLPLSFPPDPLRAEAAVAEMKRRVGISLRHITRRASPHIAVPEGRIDRALADINGDARLKPVLFAIHAEILDAIEADNMGELQALFEELDRRSFTASAMTMRPFTIEEFGERDLERYRRHAVSDPDIAFDLVAPSPTDCDRFTRDIRTALAALEGAAPEISGEIEGLTTEIVIAAHDPAKTVFDGITAFGLWGALTINPRVHPTVTDVMEVLVHEATHALLFTFCLDEPLVRNPRSDRFSSPVRKDPRPMDGLFHGTYVLARVHYALDHLVKAGILGPADHEVAERRLPELGRQFFQGMKPIRQHALLTETGRAVLADAERYMAQTF